MAATERVPVLMSPEEKNLVVARARKAGLTTAEFMRRAAAGYSPDADEEALEAMIEEMNKATERAGKAIDEALAFVAASSRRIARMEAGARKKAEGEAA